MIKKIILPDNHIVVANQQLHWDSSHQVYDHELKRMRWQVFVYPSEYNLSKSVCFHQLHHEIADNIILKRWQLENEMYNNIKQSRKVHEAARSKLSSSSFTRQSLEIPLSGKSWLSKLLSSVASSWFHILQRTPRSLYSDQVKSPNSYCV